MTGPPGPAGDRLSCQPRAYQPWRAPFELERAAYPKPDASCRPQLVNHRICGHRDWGRGASCVRTACPGINVYKRLPAIREQAAALIPHIQDFHLMEILKRG